MMKSPFRGRVKVFADGADLKSMLEMAKNPVVKGFTTNPTLMKKAGLTDYEKFSREVLETIPNHPISFEVFADDFKEMHRQALKIAAWGKNVYVKIPVTNSKGESAAPLMKDLSKAGVKLNITALFTINQVLTVCDSVRGGAPSVISVFAGRIADSGRDPIPMMQACLEICKSTGPECELLWASSRELLNIVQADMIGCPIITCTPDLIAKLSSVDKDLDQFSLETVKMFKDDAEKAGFRL